MNNPTKLLYRRYCVHELPHVYVWVARWLHTSICESGNSTTVTPSSSIASGNL